MYEIINRTNPNKLQRQTQNVCKLKMYVHVWFLFFFCHKRKRRTHEYETRDERRSSQHCPPKNIIDFTFTFNVILLKQCKLAPTYSHLFAHICVVILDSCYKCTCCAFSSSPSSNTTISHGKWCERCTA